MNSGSIVFSDACNEYLIPFDILMEDEPERRTGNRKRRQALCNMVNDYVNMRIDKLSAAQWNNKFQKELEVLLEIDEDNILYNLFRTQMLIGKERYNEANGTLIC